MFDATRLLGDLLQTRSAPSGGRRVEHAMRGTGQEGGGMGELLAGLLGNRGGAGGTPGGGAPGGGIGDLLSGALGNRGGPGGGLDLGSLLGQIGQMARQTRDDPVREVRGGNPVAVGGLGALAGGLLGRGGGGAVTGGLLAVLGSLAWRAMREQGGAGQAPALPESEDELQHESRLILRAIIQAAQADGQVDQAEIGRIATKLQEAGEDEEARAFVEEEMLKAPDVAALAREVRSPEQAARVYAASLLAIEVDTEAERQHLARLAEALRLPPAAVARIHRELGVPV